MPLMFAYSINRFSHDVAHLTCALNSKSYILKIIKFSEMTLQERSDYELVISIVVP